MNLPCEVRRGAVRQVLLDLGGFYPFVIRFGGTESLQLLQHFCVGLVLGFF
jgi:hypothetical protein